MISHTSDPILQEVSCFLLGKARGVMSTSVRCFDRYTQSTHWYVFLWQLTYPRTSRAAYLLCPDFCVCNICCPFLGQVLLYLVVFADRYDDHIDLTWSNMV